MAARGGCGKGVFLLRGLKSGVREWVWGREVVRLSFFLSTFADDTGLGAAAP